LQELLAQARLYAPEMVVEGVQILERLREVTDDPHPV
jgi:hypothetical protein